MKSVLSLVAVLPLLAAADEAPPTASDQARELFAWFDSLGFPDLVRCKFVRVATGYSGYVGAKDEPREISYFKAFLVREDAKHFTVFTSNLDQVTYTKKPPGTPKPEQIGYEPWDLAREMTGRLEELRKFREEWRKNPAYEYDPRGGYFDKLTEVAELVVWARACAAQGHADLARGLLDEARPRAAALDRGAGKSFQRAVGDEIARARLWNAVSTFFDVEVSRKELLARFTWIVRHFSQSEPAKEARRYADLLGKMVAEDEAHARRLAKPKQEMTTQERVAELIFRLRDQHLPRWRTEDGDYFMVDLFDRVMAGDDTEKDPFIQLVDIGPEAVPQLIAALDDERFTRRTYSGGFHSTAPHFVYRVGDAAEGILECIAGRTFWKPRRTSTTIVHDERLAEVKVAIQAWWQELQEKDDERLLTERTQAGDGSSVTYAKHLIMKYPDRALAAIREGARRAPQDTTRRKLVELAASLKGHAAVAFLREELQGPALSARVAAAQALLDRGRDEGVAPMIQEWKKTDPAYEKSRAHNARDQEVSDDLDRDERGVAEKEWAQWHLIRFLLRCGKPEAVRTLAEGWTRRPVSVCEKVIDTLKRMGSEQPGDDEQFPAAVEQAIDELLVAALDDTRECTGVFDMRDDRSVADPRLSDLSGNVLSQRWKQPSAFDLFGTLKTRDRQRVGLQNVWLKKQGRPPVALPVRPSIERLPDEQVLPLLRRLENARAPEERRQARASVLALGLPGLPAVRARLHHLKQGQPAFAALEEVAVPMACIVEEIRFAERSVSPTAELKQRVEGWKGKLLTADRVVDLLQAVASELPPGVTGIKLAIDREGDDTGVQVAVTLTSAEHLGNGRPGQWESSESVSVDCQVTHWDPGRRTRQPRITADHWREFRKYFESALQAPPESSLSARVGIVRGR